MTLYKTKMEKTRTLEIKSTLEIEYAKTNKKWRIVPFVF